MVDELIAAKATENNLLVRVAKLEAQVAQLMQNQASSGATFATGIAGKMDKPATVQDYTLTGVSADRALASSDTLAGVINVLGTVINDLITWGVFR